MSISLTGVSIHDECKEKEQPKKECGEKHTQRVANATLEIAIDVQTDFDCKPAK